MYAYNLKPLRILDIKVSTGNSLYVGTSWIPLRRQVNSIPWKPAGDEGGENFSLNSSKGRKEFPEGRAGELGVHGGGLSLSWAELCCPYR